MITWGETTQSCRWNGEAWQPVWESPHCRWQLADECYEPWSGECGILWVFTDGGPTDNGVNYCPRCGRLVLEGQAEAVASGDPADDDPFGWARAMLTDESDWALDKFRHALTVYVGRAGGVPAHSMEIFGPYVEVRPLLPDGGGVYVIYQDDPELRFLYVGMSQNLRQRLGGRGNLTKNEILVVPCDSAPARQSLERTLIRALNPELNKVGR